MSLSNCKFGKIFINFAVGNSSFTHADKKDILIFGKGPADGLDNNTVSSKHQRLNILLTLLTQERIFV